MLLQEREVEEKEVTPGAEYRLTGVAPRRNNNYPDEPVVLQYLYRTRDRIRRYYEVGLITLHRFGSADAICLILRLRFVKLCDAK